LHKKIWYCLVELSVFHSPVDLNNDKDALVKFLDMHNSEKNCEPARQSIMHKNHYKRFPYWPAVGKKNNVEDDRPSKREYYARCDGTPTLKVLEFRLKKLLVTKWN